MFVAFIINGYIDPDTKPVNENVLDGCDIVPYDILFAVSVYVVPVDALSGTVNDIFAVVNPIEFNTRFVGALNVVLNVIVVELALVPPKFVAVNTNEYEVFDVNPVNEKLVAG